MPAAADLLVRGFGVARRRESGRAGDLSLGYVVRRRKAGYMIRRCMPTGWQCEDARPNVLHAGGDEASPNALRTGRVSSSTIRDVWRACVLV